MLLTGLAVLALASPQTQTPPVSGVPTASDLIGQMFKRYSDAKTVSGRIRMVQAAMTSNYEVDTELALERPNLIYLEQHAAAGNNPPASLVSDGVRFVYTAIVGTKKNPMRMMETLNPDEKHHLHIPDIYPCVFSTLADRSVPLDVAVGRNGDLRTLVQHLQSFSLKGTSDVLGRKAYDINGVWADNPLVDQRATQQGMGASGNFDLYISPDGDFVRLEIHERFGVDAQWLIKHHLSPTAYPDGIEVTSTWDADLKVDQPVDHQQFSIKQG